MAAGGELRVDSLPISAHSPILAFMAFELVIHAPEGDIVLGSYDTRTAAEKLAAIAVPPGEQWSVIEIDGDARPAAVIDLAGYRAKRRARHQKG
jgi:hypothetical protein